MSIPLLQSSIAAALGGFPAGSLVSGKRWNLDEWFEVHIPILRTYFHRPDSSIIGAFLPKLPDPGCKEGRVFWAWHKKIERNASIVRQLKESAQDRDARGFINCEICRAAPGARFGVETIEAHHILPVSQAGVRTIRLKDFMLVCPNCHAAIHAGARIEMPSSKREG